MTKPLSIPHILCLPFTLILLNFSLYSQEVDNQLWINYAGSHSFNTNFSLGGDVGFRGFITNQDWNQILIRPAATYRFNPKFSIALAIASFNTFNHEDNNLNEFRIHQDINFKWPDLKVLFFFFRFRAEQRFFFLKDKPNDFKVRLRLLGGIQSKDLTFISEKRPIYFQAIYEGFQTLGNESEYEFLIDQARIHAAFGHKVLPQLKYEIHYIWQKARSNGTEQLSVNQHIIRLRVYHKF